MGYIVRDCYDIISLSQVTHLRLKNHPSHFLKLYVVPVDTVQGIARSEEPKVALHRLANNVL
jgi:hypothetical protein